MNGAPARAPGAAARAPGAAAGGRAGLRGGRALTWLGALRSLVKERIVLMVVAATALGYGAADAAPPGGAVLALVLIGTALLAAGSGVLNNVLEHEVDARMERTRRRALPRGAVSRRAAAWFGALLLASGGLLLWRGGGLLPALIGALAALLYLLAYTPMKRLSWLNTPLGAIPGALPPLIGWAAAGGGLQAGAWVLFAVLFLWQHPHFYAIAWAYRDDYRRAGLKMASDIGAGGRFLATQVIAVLAALIPVSIVAHRDRHGRRDVRRRRPGDRAALPGGRRVVRPPPRPGQRAPAAARVGALPAGPAGHRTRRPLVVRLVPAGSTGRLHLLAGRFRTGAAAGRRVAGRQARELFAGVVGGAHERARLAVHEADLPRRAAQLGELLGVPVAHHRELLRGGLQVLADVDDRARRPSAGRAASRSTSSGWFLRAPPSGWT